MSRRGEQGPRRGRDAGLYIGAAIGGLAAAFLGPTYFSPEIDFLHQKTAPVVDAIKQSVAQFFDAQKSDTQNAKRKVPPASVTVVPSVPVETPSVSGSSAVPYRPTPEQSPEAAKGCLKNKWSVAEKYGLGLIVPVNADGSYYGDKGKTDPEKTRELLQKYKIGGAIVMNSVASRPKNSQNLLALSAAGVELSTDQEGGKVQRFNDAGPMPSQKDVVAKGMTAEEVKRTVGAQYRMLKEKYGITRVLGPVLDLPPASGKPSKIGDSRIFSGDVAKVTAYGSWYIGTAQELGMLATLKHFGGGSMSENTDAQPAIVPSRAELRKRDWLPYAAPAIKKSGSTIMVTSATPVGDTLPAVLNPEVYKELRTSFGTPDTTTMSDDLGTRALAGKGGLPKVIVDATAAGLDYKEFVQGHSPGVSLETLLTKIIQAGEDAVQSGGLPRETLDASAERILKNRNQLATACIR